MNGRVVEAPGLRVDPARDRVEVDGRPVAPAAARTYILLHKPAGYLVSARDPHHDRTVHRLLGGVGARVFPVGRLDLDTTGALLFTDDGDLAHRLAHPRFGVRKVYRAEVAGVPSAAALVRLRSGIDLEDGRTAPARVRLVGRTAAGAVLEVEIHEGRKRQVRRMCAAVGHPVRRLARVAFAGLTLAGLAEGAWRRLSPAEVGKLRRLAGAVTPAAGSRASRRPGRA